MACAQAGGRHCCRSCWAEYPVKRILIHWQMKQAALVPSGFRRYPWILRFVVLSCLSRQRSMRCAPNHVSTPIPGHSRSIQGWQIPSGSVARRTRVRSQFLSQSRRRPASGTSLVSPQDDGPATLSPSDYSDSLLASQCISGLPIAPTHQAVPALHLAINLRLHWCAAAAV